jgi:hypothetical protein
LRARVLQRASRWLLHRQDLQGLQAAGASTSAALQAFVAKPASAPAPPPRFVAPVKPPPRVGDPDAADFAD